MSDLSPAPTPTNEQQDVPFFRDLETGAPCPRSGPVLCTITDRDHLHRAIHMDTPTMLVLDETNATREHWRTVAVNAAAEVERLTNVLAAVSAAAPDERAEVEQERDLARLAEIARLDRECNRLTMELDAALAARPAPVVSEDDVVRAVSALTASRVAWGSRSIVLRADEARALLDTTLAALGITVVDAPEAGERA